MATRFDWRTYVDIYTDLKTAGINTRGKALRHWLDHGQYEERVFPEEDSFIRKSGKIVRRAVRSRRVESGSHYTPRPGRLIIDVTSSCDLGCVDCNRSCGENQAKADEHMELDQVRKFVTESLEQGRLWEKIRVEGGEATAHPRLLKVLDILLEYKKSHSPLTDIAISSNGYSEHARQMLVQLPREIIIINSGKKSAYQDHHYGFNNAPADDDAYKGHDFSKGCWWPAHYGIGLLRYGYYPHPICAHIDRVFGFDIGVKRLPGAGHSWANHCNRLCRYCGYYDNRHLVYERPQNADQTGAGGGVSPSWQQAYSEYRHRKPVLGVY